MIMKNFTKIMNLTLMMFVIINLIDLMKLTNANRRECGIKLVKISRKVCRENVEKSRSDDHDISRETTVSSNTEDDVTLVKREAGPELPDLNDTADAISAIKQLGDQLSSLSITDYEQTSAERFRRTAETFDDVLSRLIPGVDYSDDAITSRRMYRLYREVLARYSRKSNKTSEEAKEELDELMRTCCKNENSCNKETIVEYIC